jgi:glycosyltransferase involved in cell wall biosynthesis
MKKPSTIFHVDGERGLRGGQRQLLGLAAALRARGRRSVVYARDNGELARASQALGFETRSLPFFAEWDPVTALRLARDARREDALIHAHTAHAAGAGALAALLGAPFVAHRRVDFPVSRISGRFKYGRAGRVVAVSQAIARILSQAGLANKRLAVVPDAIAVNDEEAAWLRLKPADRLAPPRPAEKAELRRLLGAEFGLDLSATWIGNLAALVPHKDHDTLLAAAVIVLLKRPTARFLIAGEGPQRARLEQAIRRMGLSQKVLLLGQREGRVLLRALDVYVQSSWGEGMGSVLIEAAACGLPIAATSAGGIPEVIDDGSTGLLAPPRDPEALASAILRLIDEPALGRELVAEGVRRLPRFGLRKMAEAMEAVYDAVA